MYVVHNAELAFNGAMVERFHRLHSEVCKFLTKLDKPEATEIQPNTAHLSYCFKLSLLHFKERPERGVGRQVVSVHVRILEHVPALYEHLLRLLAIKMSLKKH